MLRLFIALVLVSTGIGFLRPSPCRTEPPRKKGGPRAHVVAAAPAGLPAEIKVKGYGLTWEDAERNADLRAAETIADALWQHLPGALHGRWDDPATQQRLVGYVHNHISKRSHAQLEDVVLDEKLPPSKVCAFAGSNIDWPGIIRAESEYASQLTAEQRQARGRDRQLLAAQGLGLVALLLGAAFAYLSLDHWTRGRYTSWLRVAAAGLVAALGVGWWLSG